MAAIKIICWSLFALGVDAGKDVGFEGLFKSTSNVTRQCHAASVPSGVDGSFVIAGPGVFEMGKYKFTASTDGYAQFYKFEVSSGQICFSSQTMLTKFWNQSVQTQAVAPGMLFAETDPPRPTCPIYDPLCDDLGGNDNTAVNTVQVGDETLEITDSALATNVDWHSLQVVGAHKFVDKYTSFAHVLTTGSAHPVAVEGGYIALVAEMPLGLGSNYVDFVKMSNADNGLTRTPLVRMKTDSMWYAHSFGITESHAVLPLNIVMEMHLTSGRHNMKDAFQGKWNGLAVLNLKGPVEQEPTIFQVDPFWHTHVANSYEVASEASSSPTIIVDIVTFKGNMFNGPMVILSEILDKTTRDSNTNRGVLKRYTLTPDGNATTKVLSNPNRQFDFPKMNMRYHTKSYCNLYGSEYWHDDESVYSIAVAKLDLCKESKPMYWYRENWYPSEALFVERQGATTEDDGYLMFAALNGETQNSHLVIVNAQDMTEISNTEFQGRLAFTVHAQFLPSKDSFAPKPANFVV